MKKIKTYKQLFETGEWSRGVDLDYVLENPDCESDECLMIKDLHEKVLLIKQNLNDDKIFIINDIRGFDIYQGPYANLKIFDKNYKMWIASDISDDMLWIEDFPVDNTSQNGQNPGFMGYITEIANLLNEIIKFGGDPKSFNDIEKYNL